MALSLEVMAADYERRASEQRACAEHFRNRGMRAWVRAAQANARRYEREAAACRDSIARKKQSPHGAGLQCAVETAHGAC